MPKTGLPPWVPVPPIPSCLFCHYTGLSWITCTSFFSSHAHILSPLLLSVVPMATRGSGSVTWRCWPSCFLGSRKMPVWKRGRLEWLFLRNQRFCVCRSPRAWKIISHKQTFFPALCSLLWSLINVTLHFSPTPGTPLGFLGIAGSFFTQEWARGSLARLVFL